MAMTLDDMKASTASAFTGPLTNWIDEVVGNGADPKAAYTALALYVGHMLAGAAVELGVATWELPNTSASLIRDVMSVQISEMERM